MENEKIKAKIFYVVKSIIFAVAMVALIIYLLAAFVIYSSNKRDEERRKPMRDPEKYEEYVYIKTAYEKHKEEMGIHKITTQNGVTTFTISVSDGAWEEVVPDVAKDINECGKLVIADFYDTINLPKCISISNCECLSDDGKYTDTESDKVCYAYFGEEYRYNILDIIEKLNVENIQINSDAITDKQAFADTLKKTDIKRLSVNYYNYSDDAEELFADFQQDLNELLPDNIRVFYKLRC